ncbi:MAG: hypothetical protein ABIC57_03770 [bacterium]
MVAILVVAAVLIWKISKTVISMVIGFVILFAVAAGVWYVYQMGLPEVASGSGHFVVFVKGLEILLQRFREIML